MRVRIGLLAGTFAVLLWLEWRRPLRRTVEPKRRRLGRNLAIAALGALAVQTVEMPVVLPLAGLVERRGLGLLHLVPLPTWAALPLALVLMDYTLWVWHVLTHRVPWLWRFHVVHHADLDLDASTALRFHFAELAISVVWRAGQVAVIGVGPGALVAWQTALLVSTMFHHSNVRLPYRLERALVRVVVTPRMHGIHHSQVRGETNSNYSVVFSWWDRLHRTLGLNIPQSDIVIGVPAYADPADNRVLNNLLLPFRRQRDYWRRLDGTPVERDRPTLPEKRSRMAE